MNLLWFAQVIRTALTHGELQPSNAALLEMHGTGTALGDPIEIGAALAVLGPHNSGELFVRLYSYCTDRMNCAVFHPAYPFALVVMQECVLGS